MHISGGIRRVIQWGGLVSLVFVFPAGASRAIAQGGPQPVVVTRVESSMETFDEGFVGTASPIRTTIIGSAVDGRVDEVFYDEGEFVSFEAVESSGETDDAELPPIARLQTESLEIEISAAESELKLREEQLNELRLSLPEELIQAKANRDAMAAAATYARQRYDRILRLTVERTTTEEQLNESISANETAQRNLDSAESIVRRMEATQESRLAQAEANVESQRLEIDRLRDQLAKHVIRCPFEGYVLIQHTEAGAWVSQGDPIIEIIQTDPIELRVMVPEEYLSGLQRAIGQAQNNGNRLEAQVEFESLPGEYFTGTVERIVPQADLRTRSFPVLVRLPNPLVDGSRRFSSGMLARATFALGGEQSQLLVPKDAVVLNGDRSTVVVVDERNGVHVARTVDVQVGRSIDQRVVVVGELLEGDLIVVRGNERLRTGQEVTLIDSSAD